jgi:hypothetical protein
MQACWSRFWHNLLHYRYVCTYIYILLYIYIVIVWICLDWNLLTLHNLQGPSTSTWETTNVCGPFQGMFTFFRAMAAIGVLRRGRAKACKDLVASFQPKVDCSLTSLPASTSVAEILPGQVAKVEEAVHLTIPDTKRVGNVWETCGKRVGNVWETCRTRALECPDTGLQGLLDQLIAWCRVRILKCESHVLRPCFSCFGKLGRLWKTVEI